MDFIKMIMELPGEKRSQDVVEHTEWNNLWKLIVTQGNHSENYLEQLYDYLFNKEGWVHKVQAELDGVQPYLEGVMTQPVGKAPDGSLWTYPSTESGTVPWGNIMGDITKQQDLIQKFATKADTEHSHDINTLTFNAGDIDGSWIVDGSIGELAYGPKSIPTSALKDLSVTSEKLNNGSVTTAKIASSAVINDSIANGSVSGVKIADGAVTRVKLAQDALYSPILKPSTTEYNLTIDHAGLTVVDTYSLRNSALVWSMSKEVADAFPTGAEIAFLRSYNSVGITIQMTGTRIINVDSGQVGSVSGTVSFSLPERGSMCALKKLENDSTYGSFWILTGNVEVVS